MSSCSDLTFCKEEKASWYRIASIWLLNPVISTHIIQSDLWLILTERKLMATIKAHHNNGALLFWNLTQIMTTDQNTLFRLQTIWRWGSNICRQCSVPIPYSKVLAANQQTDKLQFPNVSIAYFPVNKQLQLISKSFIALIAVNY